MRYNTNEASLPISKLQGFTTNGAIRGEWLDPQRTIYGVFSYNTLMVAVFREFTKAYINRNKYSRTTTQHQHTVREGIRQLGYLVDNVSAEELAELLEPTRAEARAHLWADPIA